MNNIIIYILSLIIIIPPSIGQSLNANNEKYWYYRYRLINNFITVGSDEGESLPFTSRNDNAWNPQYTGTDRMAQGEGGINLGYYLAILSTEYRLLIQNGFSTDQVIEELYYALYAINRLDMNAETYFNKVGSLNGFFVRNDFKQSYISDHPSLNKYCLQQNEYKPGSGEPFIISKIKRDPTIISDCEGLPPSAWNSKYIKTPMSLDQLLGVLLGLNFVNKLVLSHESFNNRLFQDGESKINQEAKNIVHRLISFAENSNWLLKDPDGELLGNCEERWADGPGNLPGGNTGELRSYAYILSEIGKNITGYEYRIPVGARLLDELNQIAAGNAWYNLRMYIEGTLMCDCFSRSEKKVINNSDNYNWTPFYYSLGVVLNNWEVINKVKLDALTILNSAPQKGTYWHSTSDYPGNGWAAPFRFDAEKNEQLYGPNTDKRGGNYSGMDYMLLHNIYLLAYTNGLPAYGQHLNYKSIKSHNLNNEFFVVQNLLSGKSRVLKFRSNGSNDYNMLKVEYNKNEFQNSTGFDFLIGSQNFNNSVTTLQFINGDLLICFDDGKCLKVKGTGGSGYNMFAITESQNGFESINGYNYRIGDAKFNSPVTNMISVNDELILTLHDGKCLKVKGTGGSGHNMFAITESQNGFQSVSGYNYRIGDAKFISPVNNMISVNDELILTFQDGKCLKVRGTGGSGHNMFAITESHNGFQSISGFNYRIGDAKFNSPVTNMISIKDQLILTLHDGKCLKVNGTGGSGHNMFAIIESQNDFESVSGYNYRIGDSKFNTPVTNIISVNDELILTLHDGKCLKVKGTGGSGHNMFAIIESQNGFESVSGYNYKIGDAKFNSPVTNIISMDNQLIISCSNGKILKINSTGGSGHNMYAIQELYDKFIPTPGYNYWNGSDKF